MIERESPGRKLFGLFSYLTKVEVELFTSLWYNLNTNLSNKFIKGNMDAAVFVFALFKCRKFDKRRN